MDESEVKQWVTVLRARKKFEEEFQKRLGYLASFGVFTPTYIKQLVSLQNRIQRLRDSTADGETDLFWCIPDPAGVKGEAFRRVYGDSPATFGMEFPQTAIFPEPQRATSARKMWIDAMLARKQWDSYSDIGGPRYNTVKRWASGKPSTRDPYVRRLLSEAFGCKLSEVPL